MKYLNLTKSIAVIVVFSLIFAACKKAKEATPMGDAGQTLVKLLGGGTPAAIKKNPIDFVPTPTKFLAVEIRRDIPNETELQKTMVVTVKDDTAAVTATDPAYVQLPTAWYTLQIAGGVKTGGQGGTFTFTFQPGEFSRDIYITVPDATVLDPNKLYALGFTIMTADAGGKISTQKSLVIEIGAKNKYDGEYRLVGHHNRSPYNFPYDATMHMVTTGASEVAFYWPDAGSFGHPIGTGPDPINDVSWYGAAIAPRIIFDPVTDLGTSVFNGGSATPIVMYTGAGAPATRFESGTKTIYAYFYYYTAAGQDFSNRGWNDTLTYIGPR